MAAIREAASGRTQWLLPEHLIGRASTCALQIDHRYVSSQHALVRWAGGRWEIKDLGSRNGTFLEGNRLKPGDARAIRRGDKIAFGKASEGGWEVTDTSPPSPVVVPLDGGEPVAFDGDLVAIPSGDDPRVTIYRDQEGTWVLEQLDASMPISNLQTFHVAGRNWRFCFADDLRTASLQISTLTFEFSAMRLEFFVSRDEEHVELKGFFGERTIDLGSRSHNYLLLTLARRRLSDAAEGLVDTTCGWVHQDDLAHDPSMAPPHLNIDVFRIRKHFATFGVADAVNIIERRPRARQLRIGTGKLSVTQG